jgi:hypothetical protein
VKEDAMRAYEFPLKVTAEGSLEIPHALQSVLPRSRSGRVLVLVEEALDVEDEALWRQLTQEEFLAGYSEADSIYDTV